MYPQLIREHQPPQYFRAESKALVKLKSIGSE
jgi:hypothetical protein